MSSFTVLIITHGREELLSKCLSSLKPPVPDWKLVIAANGAPLSSEILDQARSLKEDFLLLEFAQKLGPGASRNRALEAVETEWVFFLDDDAYLPRDYWSHALPLLETPEVEVFGGPDAPAPGMTMLSRSLSLALTSPFCTGITYRRHTMAGRSVVSADENRLTSCNLWVRMKHLQSRPFPEDFIRTEETLLLARLRLQGVDMLYHPQMQVLHHRRSKFSQLWRPTFFAGYFRARLQRLIPDSRRGYFWLPSLFAAMHLVYFLNPAIFWSLARLYGGLVGFYSLHLSLRARGILLFPLITFFHYFIVFMFGIGFLAEKLTPQSKVDLRG